MAKKNGKTAEAKPASRNTAERSEAARRSRGSGPTKRIDKGPIMSQADDSQGHAADANPFDVNLVKQLIDLMAENELSEVALQWKTSRIRLRRGGGPVATFGPPMAMAMPQAAPAHAAPAASNNVGGAATPPAADNFLYIESPTVGTFFASPSPEAPPYVKIGAAVKPDTVVCLVEAMKVYNDIPAGLSGTIEEVLVENAAPVEFGQRLFKVRPA